MTINKVIKAFTIIELVIVITIISILGSASYLVNGLNTDEKILNKYEFQVNQRFKDLYSKALIGYNWHYINNGVNSTSYLKFYCDNIEKTFNAYICDKENITTPKYNNCIQIDFPSPEQIENGRFSSISDKALNINSCLYLNEAKTHYNKGSYYITISTIFPNGEINGYKENGMYSPGDINDDQIISEAKINIVKNGKVKEFYPFILK